VGGVVDMEQNQAIIPTIAVNKLVANSGVPSNMTLKADWPDAAWFII
jgi:hypothetical protein